MKKNYCKLAIIVFIVSITLILFSACGKNNQLEKVPVSDVVEKLMTTEGLNNCYIKSMAHYSTFDIQLEDDIDINESVLLHVRDTILNRLYVTTDFVIDENEIRNFEDGEATVQRYLVIGALGHDIFGSEIIADNLTKQELLEKYQELEERVVNYYIPKQ